jgi:CheY-like chemotaxis protein
LEGEPVVRELLRRSLEDFSLIEAATVEQAIRLFLARGRQVDLLVADVTLRVSSGTLVALLLRSEIPNLPVILTSGYPVSVWSDRTSAELDRLGPDSVEIVEKPYRAQALSNIVRELIGEPQPEKAMTAGINSPGGRAAA